MTIKAKSFYKSTCQHCGAPVWGMVRELANSGGVMRNSWGHVDEADKARNGLHGAHPVKDGIVEIQRVEFAELTKAHR